MKDIKNLIIADSFAKCESVIANYDPGEICVSVSGGADSDIVVDVLSRFEGFKSMHFVFFDTGIELVASKRHLDYLERRYGIGIERVRAVEPVPLTVKKHGQPFISKFVSERIEELQRINFEWEDLPLSELQKKYNSTCFALKWWTNEFNLGEYNRPGMFRIDYNKGLKQFLLENPPTFKVSAKCCDYAKKKTAHLYDRQNGIKLTITGERKAEGGVRAINKSCFTEKKKGATSARYRPIFWYKNDDKKEYEEAFQIVHSDCYLKYGFKRTGCSGCPFNRALFDDLEVIKKNEPKIYNACTHIFGETYELTKKYLEFKRNYKSQNSTLTVTEVTI